MFNWIDRVCTWRHTVMSLFGLVLSLCALTVTTQVQAAPPQVGDKAPNFTLKDLKQHPVTLAAQIKKGPVVLVLLRVIF